MMTWNHRVIHRVHAGSTYTEDTYAIYEVYYDENGKPTSCTREPTCPIGDTPAELARDLAHFVSAMNQPVLEWTDFERADEERSAELTALMASLEDDAGEPF